MKPSFHSLMEYQSYIQGLADEITADAGIPSVTMEYMSELAGMDLDGELQAAAHPEIPHVAYGLGLNSLSEEGIKGVLAHEIAHTIQERRSRVSEFYSWDLALNRFKLELEKEADSLTAKWGYSKGMLEAINYLKFSGSDDWDEESDHPSMRSREKFFSSYLPGGRIEREGKSHEKIHHRKAIRAIV